MTEEEFANLIAFEVFTAPTIGGQMTAIPATKGSSIWFTMKDGQVFRITVDELTMKLAPTLKFVPNPTATQCSCSSQDIFNYGCKCGAP